MSATQISGNVATAQEAHAASARALRWRERAGIAGLAALFVFVTGAIGRFPIDGTDLDAFFLPSARIALAGHPLQVYSLHYQDLYPNANGPLSLVPLTAVAALAAHLGWLDDPALRRMLVMAVFSIFALLLAWEGVAAIDRLRGASLTGIGRLFAYAVFAAAPTLWHGFWLYGHIEQPMTLWLLLLSVRMLAEGKPGRAGLSIGLAVLGRSSALVYVLGMVVLLLARRRWAAALWCALAAAATVALGLLPFYLADRRDLLFSLVTFRGALGVSGGSLLGLTIGTPYESWAQHHDSVLVLAGAVVLCGVVALRRDITPESHSMYGLLALAGICFPLLIKTLWPYYFADLFILLAVWWLSASGSWITWRHWLGALLPFYFTLCALVGEYGVTLYSTEMFDPTNIRRESLAMAVLLLGFVVAFGARLLLVPAIPPAGARARGGPVGPGLGAVAEAASLAPAELAR